MPQGWSWTPVLQVAAGIVLAVLVVGFLGSMAKR